MTSDFAMVLGSEMLWTAIMIATPVLLISMAVGLLISILQVITQVQEISLTFVPKMIAVAIAMIVLGPWMLATLIEFSKGLIGNIPLYF
jgi:flagellar biosynthesis protein FliQ